MNSKVPRRRRRLVFVAVAVGSSLCLALGAGEVAVRRSQRYASYKEKNGRAYQSPYALQLKARREPWLFRDLPDHVYLRTQPEFEIEVRTNSLGLRDVEHSLAKPPDCYRVVFLGDSFTMGHGARFEDTYPQVVGRLFGVESDRELEVIQAGVGGSDPVYCYQLLARELLGYAPDAVVLTVNGSDADDLIFRGGLDRFDAEGRRRQVVGPAWEPLFARSHLLRALLHEHLGYGWTLLSPEENRAAERRAVEETLRVVEAIRELGATSGFTFVLVSLPLSHELWPSDQQSEFAPIYERVRDMGTPVIDLFEAFRRAAPSKSATWDYYWRLDGHLNARGYGHAAEAVLERLWTLPGFPARRDRDEAGE